MAGAGITALLREASSNHDNALFIPLLFLALANLTCWTSGDALGPPWNTDAIRGRSHHQNRLTALNPLHYVVHTCNLRSGVLEAFDRERKFVVMREYISRRALPVAHDMLTAMSSEAETTYSLSQTGVDQRVHAPVEGDPIGIEPGSVAGKISTGTPNVEESDGRSSLWKISSVWF